jgi:glycosyltransferase involved in cell wall biosynthesis
MSAMKNMLHIVHLITDLNVGGAETMLRQVVAHLQEAGHSNEVISLTGNGPEGEKLKALGVPVSALGMRPSLPNPFSVFRTTRLMRNNPPDVIQTWMYHADLYGGLSAQIAGRIPVVWGIHNMSLDSRTTKHSTIGIVKLCALLSKWIPRKIVSCSEEARKVHIRLGYAPDKFVVIPNGFDLNRFHPDPLARQSLLRELGLPDDTFLVGLAARFNSLKDHQTFIRAASIFHQTHAKAHFILCGDGISWSNNTLAGWIDAAGIRQNCHLLGRRDDIPRLMAAFDVNTLSSIGEAFPNVLGEAMACGTLCVTTNVGDAAEIVGDTGIVVPPGDAQALAQGWEQILRLTAQERACLGERAREHIRSHYEIQKIAKQYESLYLQVAQIK